MWVAYLLMVMRVRYFRISGLWLYVFIDHPSIEGWNASLITIYYFPFYRYGNYSLTNTPCLAIIASVQAITTRGLCSVLARRWPMATGGVGQGE